MVSEVNSGCADEAVEDSALDEAPVGAADAGRGPGSVCVRDMSTSSFLGLGKPGPMVLVRFHMTGEAHGRDGALKSDSESCGMSSVFCSAPTCPSRRGASPSAPSSPCTSHLAGFPVAFEEILPPIPS